MFPLRHLQHLSALAHDYDGFVVDLWGVVHDGVHPLPGAIETLHALRDHGKRVVLLSNAPRRASHAAVALRAMGIADTLYDGLLTSGEATRDALRARDDPFFAALGPRCFHLGPERDRNVLDDVPVERVSAIDDADWVLNTGPDDEAPVALEDLLPLLDRMAARSLPMVCANPDLEVISGGQRVICAGLLAKIYADRGGRVRQIGKPDPAIYVPVLAMLGTIEARTAAIGDALATDMQGALAAGLDGIWVLGGIHAALRDRFDDADLEVKKAGLAPVATIPAFTW